MRRTSEISVTDITHLAKFRGYVNQNYFKNDSTLVVEKNFTEHLLCTKTRYADTFWFYQTDAIIGQSLYHYGEYTENELGLLRNFMQPTSVIYDIGANIGVHSIAFCKGTKHVYAFEPNHNNLKLLKINLSRENNKTILPYAISDSCGTTHIEQFTLGSLGNYGECKITTEGQECEKYTIDYLVDNKKILPPSIVKIDVEGHENNVFDGMQKTIKEHLPVIFFEAMYCDNAKIYDQLNGFGYDIYLSLIHI